MTSPRLRAAARGLVLDADDRVLLCRFSLADGLGRVWKRCGHGGRGIRARSGEAEPRERSVLRRAARTPTRPRALDGAGWSVDDLLAHAGPELFGPRALPVMLVELLGSGPPASLLDIGL